MREQPRGAIIDQPVDWSDAPIIDEQVREAERKTLGLALQSTAYLDVVRDVIEPVDFYTIVDQDIFRAICLHVDEGGPLDPTAVALVVSERKIHLPHNAYLVELWQLGMAAEGSPGWHARIVLEASIKRQITEVNLGIAQAAKDGNMHRVSQLCDRLKILSSGRPRRGPQPLPLDLPVRPGKFPVEVLPPAMANMVLAVAANKQVPVDLPALFGLAAIATLAGPRLAIDQGRRKGWIEALALYVVVGMESSELKSPAGRDVFRPLHRIQKAMAAAHKEAVDAEIDQLDAKRPSCALSSDPAKRKESDEIERRIEELKASQLDGPRIIAPGDTTPEKLGDWMASNGGAASILDPEGTFFGILSGRYSGGKPNVELSLNGYDGDFCGAGRIGRLQKDIDRAILTFAFGTQPAVLEDVVRNKIMIERGLMNRFLMSVPESMLGRRNPEGADYDHEALEEWERLLERVAEIEIPEPDAHPFPALVLSEEAGREHVKFKAWLEPRLAPDGDLGDINGWAGKHAGRVMRIAGLLHLAAGGRADELVSVESMRAAIQIGVWAIGHAVAMFDMATPELMASDSQCADILDWIRKKEIRRFIVRDVQRGVRTKWAKSAKKDVFIDALERLVDTRNLSVIEEEDGAKRTRVVYVVSEAVFDE